MIPHVLEVRPLEAYQLHLRFDDGSEGVVDLETRLTFRGVFAALAEPSMFRRVSVDPEAGTIVWPNGVDLDPVVLYATAHDMTPEEVLRRPAPAAGR
ncbi:MAG TPA: DUF2442 domain-containing protein [Thermoanaerobaculia bacterium]|nr:DUF2442 domain-containing protein [Thermoanaerobaculia bacterium]